MRVRMTQMALMISLAGFAMLAQAELKVTDAWVKPTAPGQPVAGAYMTLTSDQDVDVVEVSTPVAEKSEIHTMSMQGDIMRMKKLERLSLKAGKPVKLAPGGFHLMLMELKRQIKAGDSVPVTLVTQDTAGKKASVTLKVMATAPRTDEAPAEMHMHH